MYFYCNLSEWLNFKYWIKNETINRQEKLKALRQISKLTNINAGASFLIDQSKYTSRSRLWVTIRIKQYETRFQAISNPRNNMNYSTCRIAVKSYMNLICYDTNLARSTAPKYLFENNINTNRAISWESDSRLGQMVPLIADSDMRLRKQDV